jgi:hypothetical protein
MVDIDERVIIMKTAAGRGYLFQEIHPRPGQQGNFNFTASTYLCRYAS